MVTIKEPNYLVDLDCLTGSGSSSFLLPLLLLLLKALRESDKAKRSSLLQSYLSYLLTEVGSERAHQIGAVHEGIKWEVSTLLTIVVGTTTTSPVATSDHCSFASILLLGGDYNLLFTIPYYLSYPIT